MEHLSVFVTHTVYIRSYSNIDTQFVFTGSKDEFWFCAVTWQLEMHAAPGIKVA
jgi:hypothetical protein